MYIRSNTWIVKVSNYSGIIDIPASMEELEACAVVRNECTSTHTWKQFSSIWLDTTNRTTKHGIARITGYNLRITRECSMISFIDSTWFSPMLHNEGQLPKPCIDLWIIMKQFGVYNSQHIVYTDVAGNTSGWIHELNYWNSGTCECLQNILKNIFPHELVLVFLHNWISSFQHKAYFLKNIF